MFQLTPNVVFAKSRRNKWHNNPLWQKEHAKRLEAKKNKDLTYIREQACKSGHISPRYVRTDKCLQCQKESKIRYKKGINKDKYTKIRKRGHYGSLLRAAALYCEVV